LALYLLASVSPFAEREPLLRQAKLLVGALSGEQLQRTAANQLDTAIEQALAQPERMMAIDLAPLR
jgi:NAD(P)H-hydrate repair Nnr-like enzyme with NAD(P)H-hydrate epimerase domain